MKNMKSVPSLLLVLVLGTGAILVVTGKLHFGDFPRAADGHADVPAAAAGDKESKPTEGRVVLEEEAYRAGGLREAPVAAGPVTTTLRVNGEVRLADGRWSRVTPRIAGVVRELRAKPCDEVVARDVLATVESADLGEAFAALASALSDKALAARNAARWKALKDVAFEGKAGGDATVGWVDLDQAMAEHDSALSERALSEKVLGRTRDLLEKGLKTQSDLWSSEQEGERAKIRVDTAHRRLDVLGVVAANEVSRAELHADAAAAKLRALGLPAEEVEAVKPGDRRSASGVYEVRSPLAGIVLERPATVGEGVDTKDTLFVVADLSAVWVHASLYEKDLALVRQGMSAVVRVQGYPAATFPGKLLHSGLRVDEKTRTIDLQIEVPNGSSPCAATGTPLRPGMFATADLEVSRREAALTVPLAAVQTMDGAAVVFVRVAGTSPDASRRVVFERRSVVLGTRDADVVEILEGLKAGESVCVENAFLLKSELEKSKLASDD